MVQPKAICPPVIAIVAWAILGSVTLAQRGPAVVQVAPVVERARLLPTQSAVGTVKPVRVAVIGSAVDGRVTNMFVREGDRVEKDQPLASLLTETIQLDLEAAKAELELKAQELLELENGSRAEELAQTSARLEATRVAAEYLGKEQKRISSLRTSSAISISEFEKAVSLVLEAQQRYQEAQAAHKLAQAGPRSERIAQARSQVAIRDAIVRRLSDQIKKHTIHARFSGYVTAEHTEVGQWLAQGEPVAEIIALDEVDVVVRVLEVHIPFIHVGDALTVEIPALPGQMFEGHVSAIIPQADVRSRTFPVKILVTNRITAAGEPLLKAGMLARAELPIGKSEKAVLVPKDALVFGGGSTVVWTIDANSIVATQGNMQLADAIAVSVSAGAEEGELIAVTNDIPAGTLVVTRGNERIPPARPGQPPSKVTWSKANGR